nr:hypothetical protein [Tanacetum cinerariifolium]
MSSASSAVTYTSVYTDSEPGRVFWGADEELSDGSSSRVIMYGYDGLPMLPVAPPSPDYVPGLEEPQTPAAPQDEDEHEPTFIQPHDPDFMPDPIYPEYIPLEDEHVLPAKEQPLPPVVSPTTESPKDDIPETEMPPRKRLCLFTLGSSTLDAEARRRVIGEVGYGIRDTWVDPTETVPEIALMTIGEVNTRVIELAELYEHDIQDLYALLEDAQDKLRETDRMRQAQMVETLRVMGDIRREMGNMQAELLALREQPRRARQPGRDARVPNHQDAPRDAESHI